MFNLPVEARNFCNNIFELTQLDELLNGNNGQEMQKLFQEYELMYQLHLEYLTNLQKFRFKKDKIRFCGFCKKNGEVASFYKSHSTHDPITKRVVCPILFNYTCEHCGATGPYAHTKSHCPMVPLLRAIMTNKNDLSQLQNYYNMGALTSTKFNSAGKHRKIYQ